MSFRPFSIFRGFVGFGKTGPASPAYRTPDALGYYRTPGGNYYLRP